MSDFDSSYVGQLRRLVGKRLLLVPGTRIIIRDAEGCILLQERSDFGVWGLPGGNAEEGESLESVIVREVKEETGLDVFDVQPFGFGCNPSLETFTFPNGDRAQHFVMNFFTHRYNGEPGIVNDESTDLAWFSLTNLPEMLPNMRESVAAYERHLTSGQFQMF